MIEYSDGLNVTAYIDKISIFGEMEIQFNSTMASDFNWTLMMNDSWIDIYLIPEDPPNPMNLTKINFTWEVYDYQPDRLYVKITWNDAASISLKLV